MITESEGHSNPNANSANLTNNPVQLYAPSDIALDNALNELDKPHQTIIAYDEAIWDSLFAQSSDFLEAFEQEAIAEYEVGLTLFHR